MDTSPSREISLFEPIGAAFEKTQEILFRPFNMGKWFAIGFCAFLATLGGSGGGGSFNPANFAGDPGADLQDFQNDMQAFQQEIVAHLHIIIPIAIGVFVVIVAFSLVVMWLKSRGQFMFLHCVARNVAEVETPWKRYASRANSLFLFMLVITLTRGLLCLIFIIPTILILIPMFESGFEDVVFSQFVPIILLGIGVGILGLVIKVIMTLTRDFVVPVMYINDCNLKQGWRIFWHLFRENTGKFILFLLLLIVITMAVGAITSVIILVAFCLCCIGIIFLIPYVGTVALLPILVWRRVYSAIFLAQFGPRFDVFPPPDPIVIPDDLVPPTLPDTNVPDLG